ncbi:unnamed protein product [Echinostoma caproni]|uniref:Uncharacterized protein n=1 Tax=Echinostoma caproni TaxID=27848 RepID=A0A3P8GSC9_9TREM|nr:unnamed protein product [Echinostoma caproni]
MYPLRERKKRRLSEWDGHESKGETDKWNPSGSITKEPNRRRDELKDWMEQAQQNSFNKSHETSVGLKLFLQPAEVEKLHDFEEECVDDYWRRVQKNEKLEAERREDAINKKLDHLQFRIGEIHMHQNHLRGMVHVMEDHMRTLDDSCVTRPHATTQASVPVDYDYTAPASPQPMQKDLIFAQTLLYLMAHNSNQTSTPESPTQPSANLTEIQNYLMNSLQTQIAQMKQAGTTPPPNALIRPQISTKSCSRDRSPSPTGRTGRQHRSGRTEHRLPLSAPSWRGDTIALEIKRPVHLGRSLHASYRGQDYAYREYTTICDEIDLSCLSFSDSSTTTPTGSRTDLSVIGTGLSDGIASLRTPKTPSFVVPSIQISEDRNPIIPSPIPESDDVLMPTVAASAAPVPPTSSSVMRSGPSPGVVAGDASAMAQTPSSLSSKHSPSALHSSSQSLNTANSSAVNRLRATSCTVDLGVVHPSDEQPFSFSAPEQLDDSCESFVLRFQNWDYIFRSI